MSIRIPIRIYLNRDLDRTAKFDKSKDISVEIPYDYRDIELEDLVDDIKSKFKKKGQNIKSRLRDKSYMIKFFSYSNEEIQIEDDDDLTEEINDVFPDDSDDEDDAKQIQENAVELRAVFFKKLPLCPHKQDAKSCVKCNPKPIEINPPQLIRKRLGRYFDYSVQRMAYFVILEWNDSNDDAVDEKSNNMLSYDIQELNTKCNNLCGNNLSSFTYTAKPLDANKQYVFQIKASLMKDDSIITESKWSESLCINTPTPPKLLPTPIHLQVVTLKADRLFIKFDPGFVADSNDKMKYWLKENNFYGSVPFGIAQYPRPAGGFPKTCPVQPHKWYSITVWCQNVSSNQESLESKPLLIKSPYEDIFSYDYKPNPPADFQARYDMECKEIEVFWNLPRHTFGDLIEYEMKVDDAVDYLSVNNLPCRIPLNSQTIQIVTVCEIGDKQYKSNEGLYVIDASNVDKIIVKSMGGMNSNNPYQINMK